MENIILVVHVITALAIIALILLQQGKGAEAGASFGSGASQTVFGSQGGGNFFTRATAILATVFFITSFGLAIVAKQQASISMTDGVPMVDDAAAIPAAVQAGAKESDSDVPVGDVPAFDAGGAPASDIPAAQDPADIPQ
ncbi:preprotein translocase subunit SecG [Pseudomaricurvus alcaniphilus]|uniref:preprotein translocase subunit SecG n=1 Tax=Pseudomaricurvus alcaniphilus TaxID=1166482 RepID=UPI001407BEAF|nr:preprotein translocase subunit SecG [Pseudomaricurvus alcaniphilus]NHN39478.1 preprotein translocase subunit SecG [Pseudomaricurvus alcaniphilus]